MSYKSAWSDPGAAPGYTPGLPCITRLAPAEGGLALEWEGGQGRALVYEISRALNPDTERLSVVEFAALILEPALKSAEGEGLAEISGLTPGRDYCVRVLLSGGVLTPPRLFRASGVEGVVVNYIHPCDGTYAFSGYYTCSPCIIKLPTGDLLASHDVFMSRGGQNLSLLFRSRDEGRSWETLASLFPCFWGKLFVHTGALYMLAMSTEYGDLLIGRSDDGGESWTPPSVLLPGRISKEEGGPHKAPMPVLLHAGRLWTAIDMGSWKLGGHASRVISAPLGADLLDPASWTASPILPFDASWPGASADGESPSLLEGNTVAGPDGELYIVYRYNIGGGTPDYGRAVILKADIQNPAAPLRFESVIDFEGSNSKFTVLFDEESGYYVSLVNRVTLPARSQRNILSLSVSRDLRNWRVVRDILNYEENGWPEDYKKVGFQYVDFIIDGEDIVSLVRTAQNGAHNFHDANYINLIRISGFRSIL